MKERLCKYLARCGAASRRMSERLISRGLVQVNGLTVTDPAFPVEAGADRVSLEGRALEPPAAFVYYALYKPRGCTSTSSDPHAGSKVTDLVPPRPRVYPVGRLDKESEGLIILTNDGELALRLTHPRFGHEKEYLAEVKSSTSLDPGRVEALARSLSEGVAIEGGITSPCRVAVERVSGFGATLRFVLTEGKKRQVRLMCREAGLEVTRLVRVRMGRLTLGGLKPGGYRLVEKGELI
jgi:23S rRNA pseudouridine2605 synthase